MSTLQNVMGIESQIPPNILVMEDETSMANGIKMVLNEVGYAVDLAMTGRSALEKFGKKVFDVLIADLRLPDMDGMEVLKEVRGRRPETEAIVVTGYPSISSAVDSVKLGVFEYLRKPFTEDQLLGAVDGALKKQKKATMEELITDTEMGRLIQKEEVVRVLDRTSQDNTFLRDLMEKGSEALNDYKLSNRAKAAIVSGDLNWIRQNVDDLTENQLKYIYRRLEREAW